jgi:hypothetical protein
LVGWNFLFVCFYFYQDYTQGLTLYLLSIDPTPFVSVLSFEIKPHYLYLHWPQTCNPSASASQVAGITNVYYYLSAATAAASYHHHHPHFSRQRLAVYPKMTSHSTTSCF